MYSSCDIAVKVHTVGAILKAELRYGLELAQLISPAATRKEIMHLKYQDSVQHATRGKPTTSRYLTRQSSNGRRKKDKQGGLFRL